MKQIKGLLLCNEEKLSSLFLSKINQLLLEKKCQFDQMIFGFDQFNILCQKYDVILLAPYFSFYYEKYKLIAKQYQIALLKITVEEYENANIVKLAETISMMFKI